MLNKSFNQKVRAIIAKLEYPMYVIILDKNRQCTCVDHNAQADPKCPKCLGTGYHIQIRQIPGVLEPDDISIRMSGQSNKVASNYYYFDADKVPLECVQGGNIIVRDNEADTLQSAKMYRSDSNNPIYYYIEGAQKKDNLPIFLRNFRKLVGK